MNDVIVYSKDGCPKCDEAMELLQLFGKKFKEVRIGRDIALDDFKAANPGIRSAPFITSTEREFTSLVKLKLYLAGAEKNVFDNITKLGAGSVSN